MVYVQMCECRALACEFQSISLCLEGPSALKWTEFPQAGFSAPGRQAIGPIPYIWRTPYIPRFPPSSPGPQRLSGPVYLPFLTAPQLS